MKFPDDDGGGGGGVGRRRRKREKLAPSFPQCCFQFGVIGDGDDDDDGDKINEIL